MQGHAGAEASQSASNPALMTLQEKSACSLLSCPAMMIWHIHRYPRPAYMLAISRRPIWFRQHAHAILRWWGLQRGFRHW